MTAEELERVYREASASALGWERRTVTAFYIGCASSVAHVLTGRWWLAIVTAVAICALVGMSAYSRRASRAEDVAHDRWFTSLISKVSE